MDTTIRNLDEEAYRSIKARAALDGKTIGQAVSEAMRAYVARPSTGAGAGAGGGTLADLVPEAYPKGTERLSEEIDAIVYGPKAQRR